MDTKNIIWLIVVLVVLVGGFMLFSSTSSTDNQDSPFTSQDVLTNDDDMQDTDIMDDEEEMMDDAVKNRNDMSEGEKMMKGSYEPYSEEKLANANSGSVVLFFKASWCPSCRALDNDIKSKMDAIPEGVTILEVDYDSATELKKKYGVTTQHTLVQVDANGNQLKKWTGTPTLEKLLTEIK